MTVAGTCATNPIKTNDKYLTWAKRQLDLLMVASPYRRANIVATDIKHITREKGVVLRCTRIFIQICNLFFTTCTLFFSGKKN